MRRRAKIGLAGIGAAAAIAFVLLAPVVSLRVPLPDLYNQHGWCVGSSINPPSMLQIHASVSYALTGNGLVYVIQGGFLWWLPHYGSSASVACL